jgi:hypothetical protein
LLYGPLISGAYPALPYRTVLGSSSHCYVSLKFALLPATFARAAAAKNFTGLRMRRSDARIATIGKLFKA